MQKGPQGPGNHDGGVKPSMRAEFVKFKRKPRNSGPFGAASRPRFLMANDWLTGRVRRQTENTASSAFGNRAALPPVLIATTSTSAAEMDT